jgi:AraC-like DNA-binding protein
VVPAARLFGPRAEKTRQAIMGDFDLGGFDVDAGVMIGYAETLLHSVMPERDPLAEQAAALVARITDDPGLRRVDQLAASFGLSVRTLQRLFADYVGVSPKWVMRRARLHEAAERADGGEPVDWAALASDLGYADQAHLTRDFTVTIGVPPARYAAAPLFALMVFRLSSARPWAPSRAALMSLMTSAGWVRICRGVKRSTTIWYLAMRRPRASVFA